MDWSALLASAVVGTERRPPLAPEPAALESVEGTEARLLAAAVVAATTRRAGRRPARRARPLPGPAPADDRPPASEAATAMLELILAGELVMAVDDLLGEWLDRCGASGRRLPAPLVPVVLDRATARPLLRPAAATAAGPLAAWLGQRRPDWTWSTGPAAPVADDPEALAGVVETGTRPERLEALRRLRPLSPAMARLLVEQAWKGEPAAERANLLATLADGLTGDDEGLLERALDDRAAAVRVGAALFLDRLPGSARAARMAARLRPLVRLGPGRGGQPALSVDYPGEPDPPARRDGITDRPPEKMGTRAWWALQIVGGAPLSFWTDELGLEPGAVAAAGAGGDNAPELLAGLERAALAQGDTSWAAAVFPVRPTPALAAAMEPAAAAEAVTAVVTSRAEPDRRLPALLAAVPGPWPPALSREVLARYLRLGGRAVFELADALPLLAARLDPVAAPAVGAWADNLDSEGLRRSVRRLQHALSIRHEIAVEFL